MEFSEAAIKTAVELSVKYISDKKLPDKAIDIIDEAGAFAFIHKNPLENPVIQKEDIAENSFKPINV